ncbi:hypothetical protein [Enterocloster asparagiformis]|uniref:hypothetical protein n=1 Tax=Enterocloster asparagiformis TaxID=333367 RepID=UPI0004653757|nr:hypothetical protein [Enterocloster asparagiformis]
MEVIIGIILLVSFVGMVIYAVKGGNMALGVIIMAILWTILAIAGHYISSADFVAENAAIGELTIMGTITAVFQDAFTNNGANTVLFFFGAFFGRILLETGIAPALIRKTVELGGDRPVITTILLNIVVAGIFTSMFGTGAVIAIGVIVLPILLSLGINKRVALTSFMLSIGAGLYMNVLPFKQYQIYYADGDSYLFNGAYLKFGITAMIVQALITIIYIIIAQSGKKRRVSAWAAPTSARSDSKNVPGIALLTPFLPVLMVVLFNIPICFAFLVSALFALIVCGKLTGFNETARLITKNFADGVIDTAPLLCFMMFIQSFNKAAGLCAPYFNAVLGGVIPKSALLICAMFAVLAPLGLFRGPLTLAGSGAAMLGILSGLGFSVVLLYPLFYAPTMTMNISCCITQSWIVWGLNYTKNDTKEYMGHSIPCGWIVCIILAIFTYIYFGSAAF